MAQTFSCGNCDHDLVATKKGDSTLLNCPNCGLQANIDPNGEQHITRKGRSMSRTPPIAKYIALGIIVLIALIIGLSSIVFIPAGSEGVVLNWGAVSNTTLNAGAHIIIPIEQSVQAINIRTQAYSVETNAPSHDLQSVDTVVTLDYYANPAQVNPLYKNLGLNYQQTIISPIVQETVKAVEANFTAENLTVERPLVQSQIQNRLTTSLSEYDLIVQQVSLVNFNYTPQFQAAIENKTASQQQLLQSKIQLNITQVEAQQRVAAAQGNATSKVLLAKANASATIEIANGTAESIAIINNRLNNSPSYLQYLIDSRWNGAVPLVSGSGASPLITISGNSPT